MFDCKVTDSGNRKEILLSGEFTLSNAEQFRLSLLEAMKSADNIVIDLNGVYEFDLSCLQVIYSAYKMASKYNKSMEVAGRPSAALIDVFKNSGFYGHKGCLSAVPGWQTFAGGNIG